MYVITEFGAFAARYFVIKMDNTFLKVYLKGVYLCKCLYSSIYVYSLREEGCTPPPSRGNSATDQSIKMRLYQHIYNNV